MATTSPDNIWTPDSGDDYALTVDLAATADTVQTALNSRVSTANQGAATYSFVSAGVPDNQTISSAATTVAPGETNNSGFVTSITGTAFTLAPGYYSCTANVNLGTASTGRSLVELFLGGGQLIRNTVTAPEDKYGTSASFYLANPGTLTVQFLKNTGSATNVTGRIGIVKTG